MLRRYQVWSCSSSTPGARSVQAENREQAIALARRFNPTGLLVAIDAELMELAHPITGEGGSMVVMGPGLWHQGAAKTS